MADLARDGSDVSKHLRPCLSCGGPNEWVAITRDESTDDPYPNRTSR
jgi:hypothetical protein